MKLKVTCECGREITPQIAGKVLVANRKRVPNSEEMRRVRLGVKD